MSIYKTAINKPITTLLIFVAVIILGLFSLARLPIDQMPEIDAPYVSIMTAYPGANSSEIETNVTEILENTLNSVDDLKEMTSTSKDNMSIITLEFEWGSNLDEATNDIRSYIDMVRDDLPDGCSTPLIFKLSTSMMPVLQYAITAEESYPGLEKILDDNVVTVLNRIDGIGNISLSGAPERYIYVELDPQKLNAYGLSLEAVGTAISNNNLNLASGSVKMGKEQYQLRVEGEYVESSEINDIVVSTAMDGSQVFVRDLAVVRDTIKDLTVEEKVDGGDGVRLMITRQSGANSVQIANDVRREMEQIQKTLPPDIKFQIIYDSSEDITNAIHGLAESIFFALLFVVLVVLFFLGKSAGGRQLHQHHLAVLAYRGHRDGGGRCHRGVGEHHEAHRARLASTRSLHLRHQRSVGVRHRHHPGHRGGIHAAHHAAGAGRGAVQGTGLDCDHRGVHVHHHRHLAYPHAVFQTT